MVIEVYILIVLNNFYNLILYVFLLILLIIQIVFLGFFLDLIIISFWISFMEWNYRIYNRMLHWALSRNRIRTLSIGSWQNIKAMGILKRHCCFFRLVDSLRLLYIYNLLGRIWWKLIVVFLITIVRLNI